MGDGYAQLVTMDPQVAEKNGLVEESEYWDGDEEAEGESGRIVQLVMVRRRNALRATGK